MAQYARSAQAANAFNENEFTLEAQPGFWILATDSATGSQSVAFSSCSVPSFYVPAGISGWYVGVGSDIVSVNWAQCTGPVAPLPAFPWGAGNVPTHTELIDYLLSNRIPGPCDGGGSMSGINIYNTSTFFTDAIRVATILANNKLHFELNAASEFIVANNVNPSTTTGPAVYCSNDYAASGFPGSSIGVAPSLGVFYFVQCSRVLGDWATFSGYADTNLNKSCVQTLAEDNYSLSINNSVSGFSQNFTIDNVLLKALFDVYDYEVQAKSTGTINMQTDSGIQTYQSTSGDISVISGSGNVSMSSNSGQVLVGSAGGTGAVQIFAGAAGTNTQLKQLLNLTPDVVIPKTLILKNPATDVVNETSQRFAVCVFNTEYIFNAAAPPVISNQDIAPLVDLGSYGITVNAATGEFTILEDGWYHVEGNLPVTDLTASTAGGGQRAHMLRVNSSINGQVLYSQGNTVTTAEFTIHTAGTVYCVVGEVLKFRWHYATPGLTNNTILNNFNVVYANSQRFSVRKIVY